MQNQQVTDFWGEELASFLNAMDPDEPLIPMRVVEEQQPLEKTRLFGPFSIEVIAWVVKMGSLCRMGWDADGREYVEY